MLIFANKISIFDTKYKKHKFQNQKCKQKYKKTKNGVISVSFDATEKAQMTWIIEQVYHDDYILTQSPNFDFGYIVLKHLKIGTKFAKILENESRNNDSMKCPFLPK